MTLVHGSPFVLRSKPEPEQTHDKQLSVDTSCYRVPSSRCPNRHHTDVSRARKPSLVHILQQQEKTPLSFFPSMNDEFDSEDEQEKSGGTVGSDGMKDHPFLFSLSQWISG